MVVRTIRPDTVFIPYHWPGRPQREPADAPHARPAQQDSGVQGLGLPDREGRRRRRTGPRRRGTARRRERADVRLRVLRRSLALHRLPGLRERLRGVRDAPRRVDDPRRLHRPARTRSPRCPTVCMHCDDPTCAQVCPADAIKKGEDGVVAVVAQAALHRLLQLRAGLSVRHSEGACRARADDEVRHVLRPHVGRASGPMCATVCPSQALAYVPPERDRARAAREADQRLPVRQPDA